MTWKGKGGFNMNVSMIKFWRKENTMNTAVRHWYIGFEKAQINIKFVFAFALMGWSLLPNALRSFKIYWAPSNLGTTRTWICRLNFLLICLFFQAWGSLTSLKSQTRDPLHKVPPGEIVLRIFTSWNNPSISVGFEPANLGCRGEHITPRPLKPTAY